MMTVNEGLPAAGHRASGGDQSILVKRLVYAGLQVQQAAAVTGVSSAAAPREWISTRAWPNRGMTGEEET
jgi:hypothetical protein